MCVRVRARAHPRMMNATKSQIPNEQYDVQLARSTPLQGGACGVRLVGECARRHQLCHAAPRFSSGAVPRVALRRRVQAGPSSPWGAYGSQPTRPGTPRRRQPNKQALPPPPPTPSSTVCCYAPPARTSSRRGHGRDRHDTCTWTAGPLPSRTPPRPALGARLAHARAPACSSSYDNSISAVPPDGPSKPPAAPAPDRACSSARMTWTALSIGPNSSSRVGMRPFCSLEKTCGQGWGWGASGDGGPVITND